MKQQSAISSTDYINGTTAENWHCNRNLHRHENCMIPVGFQTLTD